MLDGQLDAPRLVFPVQPRRGGVRRPSVLTRGHPPRVRSTVAAPAPLASAPSDRSLRALPGPSSTPSASSTTPARRSARSFSPTPASNGATAATPPLTSSTSSIRSVQPGAITDANTPATGWLDFELPRLRRPDCRRDRRGSRRQLRSQPHRALDDPHRDGRPGQEIWLRWLDPNDAGNDHGLAVDDLSLTPQGAVPATNLSIDDVSLNEGDAGTTTFTFTVSLSSPAPVGDVSFDHRHCRRHGHAAGRLRPEDAQRADHPRRQLDLHLRCARQRRLDDGGQRHLLRQRQQRRRDGRHRHRRPGAGNYPQRRRRALLHSRRPGQRRSDAGSRGDGDGRGRRHRPTSRRRRSSPASSSRRRTATPTPIR